MLWPKACPRCKGGDLFHDDNSYGGDIVCLQCGYRTDLIQPGNYQSTISSLNTSKPSGGRYSEAGNQGLGSYHSQR